MAEKNAPGASLAHRESGALPATHWSPWNELAELRRQMDDLFSRAFGYTPLSRMIPALSGETFTEPDVDICETDDNILVTAALPGYKPDQINVEATADTLSIKGERPPFSEYEQAVRHRQSRMMEFNSFSVSFSLPAEIDPNKIKANFRDGVLHLEMPKTEQARHKSIKVHVQAAS
jgi:HSP20 family protein